MRRIIAWRLDRRHAVLECGHVLRAPTGAIRKRCCDCAGFVHLYTPISGPVTACLLSTIAFERKTTQALNEVTCGHCRASKTFRRMKES